MRNFIAKLGCRLIEDMGFLVLVGIMYGIAYLFNKETAVQNGTMTIAVCALYKVWKMDLKGKAE